MPKTKIIKNIKHGIVFWITGFPGSGKTKISSLLHKKIEKKFGKTVRFSGDDLRIILNLKGYSKKEREKIGNKYHDICKRFSSKGINVLIDVVCLIDSVRNVIGVSFLRIVHLEKIFLLSISMDCILSDLIDLNMQAVWHSFLNNHNCLVPFS